MVTIMPLAFLALMLVQLNFGILPTAQKLALHTLTPLALFGIRTVMGASLFFLFYKLWSHRKPSSTSEAKTPARVYFMLSLLGIALNQFLLILALTHTTAIATVVVVPSITLFTYGFAILLKRERFEWSKAVTLLLGGMGVLLLFGEGLVHMLDHLDASIFLGNVLCLISAAVYAYYLVISRDYVGRQSAVEFTSRMFGAAVVWFTLLLLGSWLWQLTQDPGASLLSLFVHEAVESTGEAWTGFTPQPPRTPGLLLRWPGGHQLLFEFLDFETSAGQHGQRIYLPSNPDRFDSFLFRSGRNDQTDLCDLSCLHSVECFAFKHALLSGTAETPKRIPQVKAATPCLPPGKVLITRLNHAAPPKCRYLSSLWEVSPPPKLWRKQDFYEKSETLDDGFQPLVLALACSGSR